MNNTKLSELLARDGFRAAPTPVKPARKTTSDLGKGLNAAANSFVANVAEATARGSKWMGEELAQPFEENTAKRVKDAFDLKGMQKLADRLNRFADSLNYEHEVSLDELKKDPSRYMRFLTERAVQLVPQLAGALTFPPSVGAAVSNQTLNDRLLNDGKTLDQASKKDVALSVATGVVSMFGDTIAAKALVSPFIAAGKDAGKKSVTKEAGKALALQTSVEGVQSGIEHLGATLDTKRGTNASELGDAVLEGVLVGAGIGTPAAGATGVRTAMDNRVLDKQAAAAPTPAPEPTPIPAPTPAPEPTPIPAPTPESAATTGETPEAKAQRFTTALGMPEALASRMTAPREGLSPLTPTPAEAPTTTTEAAITPDRVTTPIEGLPPLTAAAPDMPSTPAGKPRIRLKPTTETVATPSPATPIVASAPRIKLKPLAPEPAGTVPAAPTPIAASAPRIKLKPSPITENVPPVTAPAAKTLPTQKDGTVPVEGLPPLPELADIPFIHAGKFGRVSKLSAPTPLPPMQDLSNAGVVQEALQRADLIIADMGDMATPEDIKAIRSQEVHDAMVDNNIPVAH